MPYLQRLRIIQMRLIINYGVPGNGNYHKSAGCFQERPFLLNNRTNEIRSQNFFPSKITSAFLIRLFKCSYLIFFYTLPYSPDQPSSQIRGFHFFIVIVDHIPFRWSYLEPVIFKQESKILLIIVFMIGA